MAERLGCHATCGVGPGLSVAEPALEVLAKHDPKGVAVLSPGPLPWHLASPPRRPLTAP